MNQSSYKCCDSETLEFNHIAQISSLLKILAEENRLRILCLLNKRSHCVCDIITHFDMSQSLISHHLSDLRSAGIVIDEKKGRQVIYSLTPSGKKIMKIIFSLRKDLL